MAESKIKLIQIHLSLENETRAKKQLPLLRDVDALISAPESEVFWEKIPNIFKLSLAKIDTEKLKVNDGEGSLVLKLFANKETMEIRQFAAKFTDEPETVILPS